MLGFKSNARANLPILESMKDHFPMSVLWEAGLWQRQESTRPNPQFHGWGRIGRRRSKDDSGLDKEEWGWVQPILIPYFDATGELVHIRPHKGGVKGKPARLYVPRVGGQKNEERFAKVFITEGEFKASALWQWARTSGVGVAALPGVQMANNYICREELEHWLERVGAKKIIIVYDNEQKGDPEMPGYKAEWEKRYDAQIWAHVLAARLKSKQFSAAVSQLPTKWQIAGKADWDGAMASLVSQRMNIPTGRS